MGGDEDTRGAGATGTGVKELRHNRRAVLHS